MTFYAFFEVNIIGFGFSDRQNIKRKVFLGEHKVQKGEHVAPVAPSM